MNIQWSGWDVKAVGNGYGYAVTRQKFRDGLVNNGWTLDDDAPWALSVTDPDTFQPVRGKKNILYTMWEREFIDPDRVRKLRKADAIITPTTFCADVFKRYTNRPVYVSPMGVDVAVFTYKKRRKSLPFRWLWVGAPNARKGWDVLQDVWNRVFNQLPGTQLYIKTTGVEQGEGIQTVGNIVVDSRNLSTRELAKLYGSAHGFVFPTAGEGWGLSLSEAMSTGLPCLATRYSGLLDFTDPDSVYYVGFDWVDGEDERGKVVRRPYARILDVARSMRDVMTNYTKALLVGRRASDKMKRWTWTQAVRRLSERLRMIV